MWPEHVARTAKTCGPDKTARTGGPDSPDMWPDGTGWVLRGRCRVGGFGWLMFEEVFGASMVFFAFDFLALMGWGGVDGSDEVLGSSALGTTAWRGSRARPRHVGGQSLPWPRAAACATGSWPAGRHRTARGATGIAEQFAKQVILHLLFPTQLSPNKRLAPQKNEQPLLSGRQGRRTRPDRVGAWRLEMGNAKGLFACGVPRASSPCGGVC